MCLKCKAALKNVGIDEHASLFVESVGDEEKKNFFGILKRDSSVPPNKTKIIFTKKNIYQYISNNETRGLYYKTFYGRNLRFP